MHSLGVENAPWVEPISFFNDISSNNTVKAAECYLWLMLSSAKCT
jgi:hypothetical protein